MEEYTNELIKESSPYLLQHAHNPVNWVAWSDDIFERAKKENKMVLVSGGYSACHWCHVMEHECFEDLEVATLMNKFFINVKVDREERPDVDQVYMTAVQLMTQKGGWPLNCFTLPDGRPVYGGTYFPKEQWMHILKSLNYAFVNELDKFEDYAKNLLEGIVASEQVIETAEIATFEEGKLNEMIQRWSKNFDRYEGGDSRAPKFPLPSNYDFFLNYIQHSTDNIQQNTVQNHVELSLDKMALGGIYDQIGGGFSRYAVDMLWKVPHFEKMLYDNGQLISLYAKAYQQFPKALYKRTVFQTIDWLEREMQDENGAFYAALDADSEGVEGKFYVWTEEELKSILAEDFSWVSEFYEVGKSGYWEEGNSILLRRKTDKEWCDDKNCSIETLEKDWSRINEILLQARSERIRPGLDNKKITSWNAMTLKGLCDAYAVFGDKKHLLMALKNAKWLVENQLEEKKGEMFVYRLSEQKKINGFLDDYAHCIEAFISLYTITLDEDWLILSEKITQSVLQHFFDSASGMFFYTNDKHQLIARKMEVNDSVLPSSNSVMGKVLFDLSIYFHKPAYKKMAEQMLCNVYDGMENYGSGYSNWAVLLSNFIFEPKEVVVTGPNAKEVSAQIQQNISTKIVLAGTEKKSEIPIFSDKTLKNETMIYICQAGRCLLPTNNIDEALTLLN